MGEQSEMLRTYRDEDSSVLELGSRGVAMDVTQLTWPLSVARRVRVSAILQHMIHSDNFQEVAASFVDFLGKLRRQREADMQACVKAVSRLQVHR